MLKVGNKGYHFWVGDLIEVEILNVFENSERYRVLQDNWKRYLKFSQVYETRLKYWENDLKKIKEKLRLLNDKEIKVQHIIKTLKDIDSSKADEV